MLKKQRLWKWSLLDSSKSLLANKRIRYINMMLCRKRFVPRRSVSKAVENTTLKLLSA